MKASDLLVECLEAEGVEYVFGLPGEELEDVLFSIRDSDIEFIPVRHEQGAAFMADVHGRVTGRAGVCLSTLGPGATNLLTGVADAHLDKSPLVAITGQAGLERLHKESHQALDIVHTYRSVTKWNTQLSDPEIINESVRKAFKLAEYEKPGATHLEFPEDVAGEETDAEPLEVRERVRRPDPDDISVERAAELLENAERPLVIAGNGAVRTRTAEGLREFVSETAVPVVGTYMGKGALSDDDDHSLFTLDSGENGESADAISRADCVLAVGYDIAEHDPEKWNPELDKQIIHLDHESAEVYEHYNPDVELVCDISAGLEALLEDVDVTCPEAWYRDQRESLVERMISTPDEDDPVTVRNVLPVLRDVMADEDVLISDVGSHKMAIAQEFPTYEPNSVIISNGLASMGIAVPGGIAADLALDANVVVATGDGGFMMNAAEIETATRLGCSYTIIVFNDSEYRLITENQEADRSEHYGTELTNPDFVAFAESFGIDAVRATTWDEISEALRSAVESDGMTVVEIPME
ncbi:acetolactate synthase large subunit [Haladaptatus caseinilyticus]|uniref:acetolactate synthase large subunit n=1 Tax=Haladaptatus caseinilyticus TaxID=2993314 RepID=UPI00224A6905|nr:acetolactate synthase large subunit [Haladaptatus caseinilyticus]